MFFNPMEKLRRFFTLREREKGSREHVRNETVEETRKTGKLSLPNSLIAG
jgi:hypothetical protein